MGLLVTNFYYISFLSQSCKNYASLAGKPDND